MIPCPSCGNNSMNSAGVCQICSYRRDEVSSPNRADNSIEESIAQSDVTSSEPSWLYVGGGSLIVVGVFALLYGLLSSGAAPYSDTLNIGFLNDKTNFTIAGGIMFSTGVVCVAMESVTRRVVAAFVEKSGASRHSIGGETSLPQYDT